MASDARASYTQRVRSAFAPVALPLAALAASLVRWWMQGSGNVYTALEKRFYVADPDLGWKVATDHAPIWLGLEVCAILAALAVGLALAGWFIRRREAKRGPQTALRIATWVLAAGSLAAPIAAFASGGAPAGARDTLPARDAARIETGIAGALRAPAGTYEVVAHAGTSITARLKAGGEAFDARFARDITGAWQGDPAQLASPMTIEVSAAASAVDTGIEQRSGHARDSYLQAAKHPRVVWKLSQLIAARQDGPDQVVFRARGELTLIGKPMPIEVFGTLKRPDEAARARLAVAGDVLLVQADFELPIKDTALAPDAGDFDGDKFPIHVSLVLRRTR